MEWMRSWPDKQSGQPWHDVRAGGHLDLLMAHCKDPLATDPVSMGLSGNDARVGLSVGGNESMGSRRSLWIGSAANRWACYFFIF